MHALGKENCSPNCGGTVEQGVCGCSKGAICAQDDGNKPRSVYDAASGFAPAPKVGNFLSLIVISVVFDKLTCVIM